VSQLQRRETRADQTEQISRQLRTVALKHIADLGIDSLSMARVAKDARMSKSPLYRRYDDSIDLAVDVWDHHLRQHLQQLLHYTKIFAETGDHDALQWLVGQMHSPSDESAALIECITVGRRYEYLLETIEIDLNRELEDYLQSLPPLPTDVALSYVVFVLGGLFIGSLLPISQNEMAESFLLWDEYSRDQSFRVVQPMTTEIRPIPLTFPEMEDATLRNLVVAATKVIMRTGFEKATANRIARYANKAFSSSYAYFDSKEELMTYATEFVFRDSIVRNDLMFVKGSDEELTEIAASRIRELNTASASEDARLFRVEATLAARHHEALQRSVATLFQQSLEQVLSHADQKKDVQQEIRSVWIGVRVSGFGHNVLGVATRQYSDVNWMSTARAAAMVVREHAMKHYVDDVQKEMAL
jgi:AcrR family transcriptional regulator